MTSGCQIRQSSSGVQVCECKGHLNLSISRTLQPELIPRMAPEILPDPWLLDKDFIHSDGLTSFSIKHISCIPKSPTSLKDAELIQVLNPKGLSLWTRLWYFKLFLSSEGTIAWHVAWRERGIAVLFLLSLLKSYCCSSPVISVSLSLSHPPPLPSTYTYTHVYIYVSVQEYLSTWRRMPFWNPCSRVGSFKRGWAYLALAYSLQISQAVI